MTNNKQQTAVDWYAKQIEILHYDYFTEHISKDEKNQRLKQLKEQAKEIEKDQMEAAIIKQCAEQSTSEASKYAEGYKEGYHRAIENAKYQINKWIDKELKITQ
jgi:hypothetical protein